MSDDPWSSLTPPSSEERITAIRVDAEHPWSLFWGLDHRRHCLFILRHGAEVSLRDLPKLREIEISFERPEHQPSLVLRLCEPAHKDVFVILCRDIAQATRSALSPVDAVKRAIDRTWRWYHLLRGGGAGLLSQEEQKGLFGELLVLERYMIPNLGHRAALSSWRGPLGAAKDFEYKGVSIESKARSTKELGTVWISSEFQLQRSPNTELFLHLSRVDRHEGDAGAGETLSELAARIDGQFVDEMDKDRFRALLAAAGFRFEDDYAEWRWDGAERAIFGITDGFPALTSANIPSTVSRLSYLLEVGAASVFAVSPSALTKALSPSSQ